MRVVIADDSLLLREGVAKLLEARSFDVVGLAADGAELLRLVADTAPDVALVDIRMPPSGTDEGLRAAHEIAVLHPGTGVLVLSEYLEPEYAARLLEDGTPGRGYLLKDTITDIDSFADAIARVAGGESVVDPAIVRRLIGRLRVDDPLARLTERERDILSLMAEGRTNLAIAADLRLSERTVESHISNIFSKLTLETTPNDHRRVLAVLTFLRS